jgi:4,4'-diaponeurosporenoate glycosyltransferase
MEQLLYRTMLWFCGSWLLFRIPDFLNYNIKSDGPAGTRKDESKEKVDASDVSIIIPARNEENRLPNLLHSLALQTCKPLEVIVVDDESDDNTAQIATEAGCRVITTDKLPSGWQGKSWACWKGASQAKGEILVFLDADTVFEEDGLENCLAEYLKEKSPLSIQPYHIMHRAYENLSAFFNIIVMMGSNLFTPLGAKLKALAFFGPCQFINKEDYLLAGGHSEAKGNILEDIALGRSFAAKNIKVRCMSGRGAIKFRMYPAGISDVIEGWSKNFASGAQSVGIVNLILISLWITGASGTSVLFIKAVADFSQTLSIPIVLLFLLYGVQIYWMLYRIGKFSPLLIILYPIALLFFVMVFIRAVIMTFIFKKVKWKGRIISTGNGKEI